jgi:hypothetical protein
MQRRELKLGRQVPNLVTVLIDISRFARNQDNIESFRCQLVELLFTAMLLKRDKKHHSGNSHIRNYRKKLSNVQ